MSRLPTLGCARHGRFGAALRLLVVALGSVALLGLSPRSPAAAPDGESGLTARPAPDPFREIERHYRLEGPRRRVLYA